MRKLLGGEPLGDVLGAVPVKGFDFDQKGAFRFAAVFRRYQFGGKFAVESSVLK